MYNQKKKTTTKTKFSQFFCVHLTFFNISMTTAQRGSNESIFQVAISSDDGEEEIDEEY